ncbi:MAG: hypothetical protein HZA12_01885 [Nitrospirae bacterium]|nr:hypothetical protein [Nitrospirota bacterium]
MTQKRCPYYEDNPVRSCNAVNEGIKVPTKRDADWFCLGGHYEECPTYIEKEKEVRNFS